MPLAATAPCLSFPCAALSVGRFFWPVFRSLPVCWSAFILAFFFFSCQLILKPYSISFLSPHLTTSTLLLPFSFSFHLRLLFLLCSLLIFLPLRPPPTHPPFPISLPTIPPSFLLSAAPGVEVSLRHSRRLFEVPGALRGCVCLCASGNFFFIFIISSSQEHLALLLI